MGDVAKPGCSCRIALVAGCVHALDMAGIHQIQWACWTPTGGELTLVASARQAASVPVGSDR